MRYKVLTLLVWCVPHLSTVNMTFRGISPVGTTTYMTSLRLIHFQILYVCMYVCRRVTFWTLLQLERLLVDVLALVGHDYEGPRLTVLRQDGGVCMYVCMYMLVCQRTSPAHRGMGTPPRELLQGSRLVAAHLLHFTATTVALDLQLPHIHTYIHTYST